MDFSFYHLGNMLSYYQKIVNRIFAAFLHQLRFDVQNAQIRMVKNIKIYNFVLQAKKSFDK